MQLQRTLFSVVGISLALFFMSALAATKTASAFSLPSATVTAEASPANAFEPPGCYGCLSAGDEDPELGWPAYMGAPCETSGYQECAQCDFNCEYGFNYWNYPCSYGCPISREFEEELGFAINNENAKNLASLLHTNSRNLSFDKNSGLIQWLNCNGNVDYKRSVAMTFANNVNLQLVLLRKASVQH